MTNDNTEVNKGLVNSMIKKKQANRKALKVLNEYKRRARQCTEICDEQVDGNRGG